MPKYTVEHLTDVDMEWFVETAAVKMLTDEAGKPEYVNIPNLYSLASLGAIAGTAFVAKCDGVPVGALGGIVSGNPFNPDIKTLTEVFWYVLPEHRNSRVGLMLLNEYMNKAEQVADESTLSLLSTSKVNNASYEKRGYMYTEQTFRKTHWRT